MKAKASYLSLFVFREINAYYLQSHRMYKKEDLTKDIEIKNLMIINKKEIKQLVWAKKFIQMCKKFFLTKTKSL